MATNTAREKSIDSLEHPFDLVVIGGGVNGLAVAWQAAVSGVRVLVVDKGDWGSGTSAWSSRMIHGGLKYLEKLDVRLVRESLRDREWLLRVAPHLVKPLPFFLPFFKGDAHSKLALRTGMIAYDVLSYDKSVPNHRVFNRKQTMEELPGLKQEGLKGSARYFDAQVEYSERLCVEMMLGAQNLGAVCLNYFESTKINTVNGQVVGVDFRDELTGLIHSVESKVVINVAGPWVDEVLAGTESAKKRYMGGTKGTHLVVDSFHGAPKESLYYESEDHRPMMVIPWLGRFLIGSTDVRFHGDLDDVRATQDDVDYILFETNKVFPKANLTMQQVHYSYTGVRPLPYVSAGKTADISRRHKIVNHSANNRGLFSVIGGKLTTFRALAKHVTNEISPILGVPFKELTHVTFPGAEEAADPKNLNSRLSRIYGSRSRDLTSFIEQDKSFMEVVDQQSGLTRGEVLFSVRAEGAQKVVDVICRRTMLGFDNDLGARSFDAIQEIMAEELNWTSERSQQERNDFDFYVARSTVLGIHREVPTRN